MIVRGPVIANTIEATGSRNAARANARQVLAAGLSNGWGSRGPVDEKRPDHDEENNAYLVDERYFYLANAQGSVVCEESRYGETQHCDQYILERNSHITPLHFSGYRDGTGIRGRWTACLIVPSVLRIRYGRVRISQGRSLNMPWSSNALVRRLFHRRQCTLPAARPT